MKAAALRRATCAAVTIFAGTLATAMPGSAQGPAPVPATAIFADPAGPEPAVFSVRVGALPARTYTALVDAQRRLLLPVGRVLEAAGVPFAVGGGAGAFRPESGGIAADSVRRQLRSDTTTIQLDADELVMYEGEVYAAAGAVAEMLDADVDVDWHSLTAQLRRARPFAAEARLAAAERRARVAAAAPAGAGAAAVPYRARWGGAVLDWELSSESLNPARSTRVTPTLGTAIWGGEFKVAATMGTDARGDAVPVEPQLSYRRVFPTSSLVRQVEVGDVVADGPFVSQLRGLRVTNEPHAQESVFGSIPIHASVPAGWSYEVYQGGRLVGFSDAISDGSPPAVIQYGHTDVQIREIGPDGQERLRELNFAVPFSMVRPGAFRYDLGAGSCRWGDCRAGGFASARYGLTSGVTVGGGVNLRAGGTAGHGATPYAALAWATQHGNSGELQVQNDGGGRASFQMAGWKRLGLYGAASLDPARRDSAATAVHRFWTGDASATYRLGAGSATTRLSGHVDGRLGGGLERWSITAALFHGGGTVETSVTDGPRATGTVGLRGTQLAGRLFGTMPASVSAGVGASRHGLQTADAGISVGALGFANVATSARWDRARNGGRPVLELGIALHTGGLRLHSRASTERGGGRNQTTLTARGSLADAGMAGVSVLQGRTAGSGGITGVVYFDRDADGAFTAGDSAIAGQVVQVAGVPVRTDARGRYTRWNVTPYEVAFVRIHPEAVSDPTLSPASPEHRLRPVPNRTLTVDFPLIRTRSVTGQVVGPGHVLGGLTVELVDARGEVTRVTTFSDGEWYTPRLRPGRYAMRIAESSLAALGARGDTAELRVPAEGDEDVEAPALHVSDSTHDKESNDAQTDSSAARRGDGGGGDSVLVGRPKDRGGRRADGGAPGVGLVPAVRDRVLERSGRAANDAVGRRRAVLHNGGTRPAADTELRASAARAGGGDEAPARPLGGDQLASTLRPVAIPQRQRPLLMRRGAAHRPDRPTLTWRGSRGMR